MLPELAKEYLKVMSQNENRGGFGEVTHKAAWGFIIARELLQDSIRLEERIAALEKQINHE